MRFLASFYVAVIGLVSLLPSGTGLLRGWDTSLTPSLQTALHLPAYAVLAFLVIVAFIPKAGSRFLLGLIVAVGCIALGILLECAQACIPGRMGSIVDITLNAIGVIMGVTAAYVWGKIGLKRSP